MAQARRDPRFALSLAGIVLGVLLVWTLYSQTEGYSAYAPYVSPLTTLFVAVLAAYVAVHTFEFLNSTNQAREWRRDDAHKLLKPVYDDLVLIVPEVAKRAWLPAKPQAEQPWGSSGAGFATFRPDFDQAQASWQDWGLGSRLPDFCKDMERYEELYSKANAAAYAWFNREVGAALGLGPDPTQLVSEQYQTLYPEWPGVVFGIPPSISPEATMKFGLAYSKATTDRGAPVSVVNAVEFLHGLIATIAKEPDVVIFRSHAEKTLQTAERLRDDIREVIRTASGVL